MHVKASQITATRLFTEKFVQANNKWNVKDPYYWHDFAPILRWKHIFAFEVLCCVLSTFRVSSRPTSVSHPFSFLDSSLRLSRGKGYQKILSLLLDLFSKTLMMEVLIFCTCLSFLLNCSYLGQINGCAHFLWPRDLVLLMRRMVFDV